MSDRSNVAIGVLRAFLILAFLTIGTAKLTGSLGTFGWFAQLGWGQWFRYFTGVLDITGALLLFLPRWAYYGAILLACTIGTATILNIMYPLRQNPVVPFVITLIAATLGWMTRPRRYRRGEPS